MRSAVLHRSATADCSRRVRICRARYLGNSGDALIPHTETVIDGILYPSVTTILGYPPKPWLEKWRAKWGSLAVRKTAAANAIGTAFHEGAEGLLWGRNVLAHGRVHHMLARFEQWLDGVHLLPVETELKVISRKYGYAGTLDAIAEQDGKFVLLDWKTSAGLYPDMELQLSAYAQAYEEMTGKKIKRGVIVLVSKKKPEHILITAEYRLTKSTFKKFLKRLADYNAAVLGKAA